MRCHIRLVLDDKFQSIQWSTDVYADDGKKLRTVVRAADADLSTPHESLDEALQDLHSLAKSFPSWF